MPSHDVSFPASGVPYRAADSKVQKLLGETLPASYTKGFIERLKRMDEAAIRAAAGPHLTESELDALLFRRETILEDVEARGGERLLAR